MSKLRRQSRASSAWRRAKVSNGGVHRVGSLLPAPRVQPKGVGVRPAARICGRSTAKNSYRYLPVSANKCVCHHYAQTIGQAAIQPGHRVLYRETHVLLDDLAEAVADGTRKEFMESLTAVPLLIIDDFGMRKLPMTAAEDLLEIVMRRYERASTLLTSNRPVEDWGKLPGDVAAVSAMLDRLLHHVMCSSVALGVGEQEQPQPPDPNALPNRV
jgi:hypothetical protein